MKYTKGFALISVLLIVLSAVIIGGGAYAIGKHSEQAKTNSNIDLQPITESDLHSSTQTTVNSTKTTVADDTTTRGITPGCTASSAPSITVLSPNGGEIYTAGQQVTVHWKSCNLAASTPIQIILQANFTGGPWGTSPVSNFNLSPTSVDAPSVLNSGSATFMLPTLASQWTGYSSTMRPGRYYKIYISQNLSDSIDASDMSDNTFTINIPTTSVSTTLPSWLDGQEGWPPVIKYSSNLYSCTPGRVGMGVPVTTTEKVINNRKYCISIADEGTAGTIYYTYTYTTADTNRTDNPGTLTTHFTLGWHDAMCQDVSGNSTPNNIVCNLNSTQPVNFNVDAAVEYFMRSHY